MPDVIVVGGGVIGLTTAWELALAGFQVTVLEQGNVGREASWAGAGMVPPGDLIDPATHELAVMSSLMWPEFSARLLSETGVDNEYRQTGGLLLHSLPALWNEEQHWQRLGVPTERIGTSELRRLEPALSDTIEQGVLLPTQGQVRNPRHVQALYKICLNSGVKFLEHHTVLEFQSRGERVTGVLTSQGLISADTFVLAAGAWSGRLLSELGIELSIRPIRGQIVLFAAQAPIFQRTLEFEKRYLVSRLDGRVLVGATEEDVGFSKGNTEDAVKGLKAFAIETVPALENAIVELTWSGLRPFTERRRPWIGRLPQYPNLIVATGHFRAGLSNSPATAKLIRETLCGQPLSLSHSLEMPEFSQV